jgi:pimeloyl-ACP methyl ester carboxylesterase
MTTFLLVLGAYCGGWFWERVAPLLVAAGHEVHAPTLTGLAERAHLASPTLGLSTHVDDVVGLIEFHDLRDVFLVGHSYGGMVVAGVTDQIPERLRHVVHLDAVAPRDGQSSADLQAPAYRAEREALLRSGQWALPGPASGWLDEYVLSGHLTQEQAHAGPARMRPHPIKTLLDPLTVRNAAVTVRRTYVWCRRNTNDAWRAERMRALPEWGYRELDTKHPAPYTHPRAVADLLLDLEGQERD